MAYLLVYVGDAIVSKSSTTTIVSLCTPVVYDV